MRKFNDDFLTFIKENILIEDIAQNVYNLEKNRRKSTKQYIVYEYNDDKIIVNSSRNSFFVSNNNEKGTIIDFVQYIENCDFVEAVKKIANYYNIDIQNENVEFNDDFIKNNVNLRRSVDLKNEIKENEKKTKEKAETWINLYKNLRINRRFDNDIRAISKDLLNYLREKEKIKYYKNEKYAVIKVPLYNRVNTICGGQDIYEDAKKWQKINHGKAGIFFVGNLKNVTTLVLTESFFDSLSALQLKYDKTKAKNQFYTFDDLDSDLATISINGSLSDLKKEAILDVIKNAKSLKTIIFAFDNDNIGKKYVDEVTNLLKDNELFDKYDVVKITFDKYKDLNEYLQAKKTRESIATDNNINKNKAIERKKKEALAIER